MAAVWRERRGTCAETFSAAMSPSCSTILSLSVFIVRASLRFFSSVWLTLLVSLP